MYKRIVVLTGAGISAESGLATFRGSGGFWEGHRVEEVATPEAFTSDPEMVQRFYNERRKILLDGIEPNPAHHALAAFERSFVLSGEDYLLITQNVDDLHDRAGSSNLIHMHGELLKARSVHTGEIVECRECLYGNEYRPHIVWFGEMPMEMDRISYHLGRCDLFVAIGTSGHVYPAAGFVEMALRGGAHTVEINLEPSLVTTRFHLSISGPASQKVPEYFDSLPV